MGLAGPYGLRRDAKNIRIPRSDEQGDIENLQRRLRAADQLDELVVGFESS